MEWVKLYATPPFYLDGALLRAGEAAEVLFCRALAHCGNVESGGRVEKHVLPMLCPRAPEKRAAALVREGLWLDEGDHYIVRSWSKMQDLHDAAAARRASDRERKRLERQRGAAASGIEVYRCYGVDDDLLYIGVTENIRSRMRQHAHESRWFSLCEYVALEAAAEIGEGFEIERLAIESERPRYNKQAGTSPSGHHARRRMSQDASRDFRSLERDVEREEEKDEQPPTEVVAADAAPTKPRAVRSTRVPDAFPLTEVLMTWGREHAPAVDGRAETENWLDWHRAKGDTAKDWTASWRTWMRRAQKDSERGASYSRTNTNKAEERDRRNLALVQHFAPTYEQGVIGA